MEDLIRIMGEEYKKAWDELLGDDPEWFNGLSMQHRSDAIHERIVQKVHHIIGFIESKATDDLGSFDLDRINKGKAPLPQAISKSKEVDPELHEINEACAAVKTALDKLELVVGHYKDREDANASAPSK